MTSVVYGYARKRERGEAGGHQRCQRQGEGIQVTSKMTASSLRRRAYKRGNHNDYGTKHLPNKQIERYPDNQYAVEALKKNWSSAVPSYPHFLCQITVRCVDPKLT